MTLLQNIMNFWKKNYKIIFGILIGIGFLISTLLIINFKRPKKNIFLTTHNDYFIVNQDFNNTFDCLIFSSIENSYYLNLKNIEEVAIVDYQTSDLYAVVIEQIHYTTTATYENKDYYGYDCHFVIPYIISDLLLIKDARLNFSYSNEETISLKIGSMCIYNYSNEGNLHYASLKGYTKLKNQHTILDSVLIKLENSSPYVITKITSLSNYANVDLKNVSIVRNEELEYAEQCPLCNSLTIELNGDDYLLLRLKYNEVEESALIGFIITYTVNDIEFQKTILPFKFFSSSQPITMIKYEYTTNYD